MMDYTSFALQPGPKADPPLYAIPTAWFSSVRSTVACKTPRAATRSSLRVTCRFNVGHFPLGIMARWSFG